MRLSRFVDEPPHADCGYECPENVRTKDIASSNSGTKPVVDQVGY